MTTDGKTVVSGFDSFKMSESLGIPLDIIVDRIYSGDMVIDWYDFGFCLGVGAFVSSSSSTATRRRY